jgi:hypothetical protein
MKSIGSLLFLFGAAAIILGFMDRVPTLMQWIYDLGETGAWAVKIGFVVVGAAMYLIANKQKKEAIQVDTTNS